MKSAAPHSVLQATLWTESVLHILAHVEAPGLAASCHNPSWIAWAAARLGPACSRPLGDDIRVIATAASTHSILARAQALAWVFDSPRQARCAIDYTLAELRIEHVHNTEALAIARTAGPVAEVLRTAAELEAPLLAELEDGWDDAVSTVGIALDEIAVAAPELAKLKVAIARPLGLRGRVLGSSILVGCPAIGCPNAEHAAWQAAHEATVSELARQGSMTFHALERSAITVLCSRAKRSGLGDAARRWLARFDLRTLGPIPDVDDTSD